MLFVPPARSSSERQDVTLMDFGFSPIVNPTTRKRFARNFKSRIKREQSSLLMHIATKIAALLFHADEKLTAFVELELAIHAAEHCHESNGDRNSGYYPTLLVSLVRSSPLACGCDTDETPTAFVISSAIRRHQPRLVLTFILG
jgi:hypothetical protein